MREFKFRAWDNYGKKMYFDGLFIGLDGDYSFNPNIMPKKYNPYEFEVMQFTGLKDEHGNDIYEGDIVETVEQTMSHGDEIVCGEVVWDKHFGFMLDFSNYGTQTAIGAFIDLGTKVIGNIYENPELLSNSLPTPNIARVEGEQTTDEVRAKTGER